VTVAAIVPAAGRGERLGLGRPKALAVVGGLTLVARAVDGLVAGGVDVVVVAAPPGDEDAVRGRRHDHDIDHPRRRQHPPQGVPEKGHAREGHERLGHGVPQT